MGDDSYFRYGAILGAAFSVALVLTLLLWVGGARSAARGGGTVTVLDVAGSVDSLDPGYWYYETDYTELGQTTQRWLYGWKANASSPTPDLATAMPVLSNGDRTLTIHIRRGVHYSAPLQHVTVSAADIKYAMERCFAASVGNGYAFTYYGEIVGAPPRPTSTVPEISGIEAPNPSTLVINTRVPVGVLTDAQALGLPCTIPVPQAYAARYDRGAVSSYGQHQVYTGPYMFRGAGNGTVPSASYRSGKLIVLVRNPSWRRSNDPIRAARFDQIVIEGGNDITAASHQILSGRSMMSGDFAAPPTAILSRGLRSRRRQFVITPSGGSRYIALNTTVKPLDNVNFRRAIAAVINRNALRLTRGGPVVGTVATHFIPPQMPGFEQAGGTAGNPADDFYANPNGNVALAESYMKKAGYLNGQYTGPPLLAVADDGPPASNTAQAVRSQLGQIGIKLTFREVPHATMLTKYCEVPKAAGGDLPDGRLGEGLLRLPEHDHAGVLRAEHRPVGQHEHGPGQRSDAEHADGGGGAADRPDPARQRVGEPRQGDHEPGVRGRPGCGTTRSGSNPATSRACRGSSTAATGT